MSVLRFKCPACGKIVDSSNGTCPKCFKPLPDAPTSFVQIYRMGSPLGIAVGYGVYINGEPFGHIANKESIRIPLPYGTYTFHFTCGMTRKCEDLTVTLSPDSPKAFVKARIRAGFWTNKIVAELSDEASMPPLN